MSEVWCRLRGLCLPPLGLACLDAVLTLLGQSPEYWAGNYGQVSELSPTFHHLLATHPLAFVVGIAGWILVFTGLILLLPETLALATSVAVVFGHTWGATSWLLYHFQYGYQACIGLFILTAIGLALGIRWGWGAAPSQKGPAGVPLHPVLRWSVIAALLGLVVYLFLWPRLP